MTVIDELRLSISRESDAPIHEQIRHHYQYLITTGVLGPGTPIPSVRQLAEHLSIARATVQRAYSDLQSLGLVESRRGAGTYIADFHHSADIDAVEVIAIADEAIRIAQERGVDLTALGRAVNDRIRNELRNRGHVSVCHVDEFGYRELHASLLREAFSDLPIEFRAIDWREYRAGSGSAQQLIQEADVILCAPYLFGEVHRSLTSSSADIEGITFRLHPDVSASLAALDPAAKVGILATRGEYLSWTVAVVQSQSVFSTEPIAACLDRRDQVIAMASHVDVVVYGTGCKTDIGLFPDYVEKIELRHIPDDASVERARAIVLRRIASASASSPVGV